MLEKIMDFTVSVCYQIDGYLKPLYAFLLPT